MIAFARLAVFTALAVGALSGLPSAARAQDSGPIGAEVDPHAGHDHAPGEGHGSEQAGAAGHPTPAAPELPDETLDVLRAIPIQDGGRVKPLDTFARFQLLKLRGTTVAYTPEDSPGGKRRLEAIEWLAHCLFWPHAASHYPVFLLADSEALDAIGLPDLAKKKRDRYTYEDLVPGVAALEQKVQAIRGRLQRGEVERAELGRIDRQLLDLYGGIVDFQFLIHQLDFARQPIDASESVTTRLLIHGQGSQETTVRLGQILQVAPRLFAAAQGFAQNPPPGLSPQAVQAELAGLEQVVGSVRQRAFPGHLAWLPPMAQSDGTEGPPETWLSVRGLARERFSGRASPELDPLVEAVRHLEEAQAAREAPAEFRSALTKFAGVLEDRARQRGEFSKVATEIAFYRGQYFYNGQILFVLSFLLIAFSWLTRPGSSPERLLYGSSALLSTLALALAVTGITLRCIIRGRPPVSTLYETILFVTATGVFVALVIEWINRQRLAISLAPVLGALGLFVAYRYEMHERQDTMPALVAVLDTNFWLATHVTTVTLGYSAGILAGMIGYLYLFAAQAKRFGLEIDRTFLRGTARVTYGVLCFGLLFSVVGTILGGIWANDSWGRFWGWDPKENGALLIVLWELAILHARMGGYIRDWGVCFWAASTVPVVLFSWFGVNLLGVGLHSYGFTSGLALAYNGGWSLLVGLLIVLAGLWFATSPAPKDASPAKTK